MGALRFSPKQRQVLTWWREGSPHWEKSAIICDGAVRSGKTSIMSLSYFLWAMGNFRNRSFALCGKSVGAVERNIVTPIAGTTRDTVEEPVRVGRVLLRLTDTAGIREAGDAIEALGVARSEQAAREAELALFVCDASQLLTDEDRRAIEAAKCAPRSLALCNKSDLPAAVSPDELPFDTVLTVSARTGAGLDALPALLEGWFLGENACDGSLLTNPRQFGALDRASRAIERAKTGLSLGVTPDAVLTDVEEAMAALGEVTGRTVREDITNRIFERFCVGK